MEEASNDPEISDPDGRSGGANEDGRVHGIVNPAGYAYVNSLIDFF